MKKWRFILTTIALVVAFTILGVSLSSSSVTLVQSATSDHSSQKEFYFSTDILPDHIAYPVLMAVDRVRLEAADPVERIYLETEYANRRLGYAKVLLEQGDDALAVTTITKSQKYLLSAAHDAFESNVSAPVKHHVLDTMEYHRIETKQMAASMTDDQRAVIDQLNQECLVVGQKLESAL